MYVEVAELDMDGWRSTMHSFDNVIGASQYEESEDGKYKERVVIEYEDEQGFIRDREIENQYGARIIRIEE